MLSKTPTLTIKVVTGEGISPETVRLIFWKIHIFLKMNNQKINKITLKQRQAETALTKATTNFFLLYQIPTQKLFLQFKEVCKDNQTIERMDLWLTTLETIVSWMLKERFLPEPKGPKKQKKMESKKGINQDLLKWKTTKEKKVKIVRPSPLLVTKTMKVFENFILKRKWIQTVEDKGLTFLNPSFSTLVDNLPTLLESVERLDEEGRRIGINLIFSSVCIYRLFKVKTIPDSSTIVGEYDGIPLSGVLDNEFSLESVREWVVDFIKDFNPLKHDIRLTIYSGNASSPNTGASTTRLLDDVAGIIQDERILNAILTISDKFKNGSDFRYFLLTLKENIQIDPDFLKGKIHSRLFHFSANGGKARMIANVDWVTQTALSGIHFLVFAILKTVPSDFTFDHKKGIPYVLKYASEHKTKGYTFYSIDLTAATDRLPVALQARLLRVMLDKLGFPGEIISKAWLEVLDRTFSTLNSGINENRPVKYAVGQGMGIFTSWPALALMHHYIINKIVGVDKERYCLVGDDLLFYGSYEEFQKYLEFMKSIGVTVNQGKTIISESTDKPTIEFARNFIVSGVQIIPIPYGMIFAHNDSKISYETLAFHLSFVFKLKDVFDLSVAFFNEIKSIDFLILAYFF